jgi:DNA-directed RNA polymerase subunit alpha
MDQTELDLSTFFSSEKLQAEEIASLKDRIFSAAAHLDSFRSLTNRLVDDFAGRKDQDREMSLKVAVALHLLGRNGEGLDWFPDAREGAEKRFYMAASLLARGRCEDALRELGRAEARGWDPFEVDMLRAASSIRLRDYSEAADILKRRASAGKGHAVWHCRSGELGEHQGDLEGAIGHYNAAIDIDSSHSEANFRLGFLYDLHGEEETAMERYRACVEKPPLHVNALINMAVIHEDAGEFDDALECLDQVLRFYPNHARARSFHKDVESAKTMYYDEDQERRLDNHNRILDTPITDFELSVRARNCLKKMNIDSLGDLLRITEAELLSYKNFGETSLNEIKAMLAQKDLSLGQMAEAATKSRLAPPAHHLPSGANQEILTKPVAELELSIRARKCLQRLDIATIGDLISRSEPELMSVKNFGATSLTEIKQRLQPFGLKLKDAT